MPLRLPRSETVTSPAALTVTRAWTGAGSVITKDVPAGSLAVERTEQRIVRGYDERTRARHAAAKSKEIADRTGKKGGRRG